MTTVASEPGITASLPEPGGLSPSDRYLELRGLTELLAAPLSPEDQTVQTMPDVSPTKWHRAHVSWFFETFLLEAYLPGYRVYHPEFAYLFNSYYEAVGPRCPRPNRGHISRPGAEEVGLYRQYVDEHMQRLLERPLDDRAAFLLELGLNHEQQHQELLLMDIKHVLAANPLQPVYTPAPPRLASAGPPPAWVEHGGGLISVGHGTGDFAYDNEAPVHDVLLRPFALADRLVTCGEWMEFIDDGGYQRPELWLSDGWGLVQDSSWSAPLYWEREADEGSPWTVFTLGGRRSVDAGEPVCHVSYYEADAFASWSGARLPTEFEWEAVAAGRAVEGRFLDPQDPHPRPQRSASFFGDTWVWTASAYLPYPGFRPAAGAVAEYNGKFMVNQHVLRGGSCVTPAGHTRPTYRNFYPPSARWPFAGVRLARDL
jgi:ergothioneine biosynthesis protein EgtB